jgi:dipeptidase D
MKQDLQLKAALWARASRRQAIGALGAAAGMALLSHSVRHVIAQAMPVSATPSPGATVPLRDAIATLEPHGVWEHFFQLTQIPRPSHHEEKVSAFLAQFGRGLGLETEVDDVGNVLIRKPASAGRENAPGTILQAHMDMVPQKTDETVHNFLTDPIAAYVEDGWVRAEGTTLGADDGIGVALIMALLEAKDVAHGPLEALFTVNEEDGETGANAVQPGMLHGASLINVDSEQEGVFTIGSAGGEDIDATMTYQQEPTPTGMTGLRIDIAGLEGGHSGLDINRGRGNAIKLLARLLQTAPEPLGVRVSSLSGGGVHNVIPREANAVVVVPMGQAAALIEFVNAFAATVKRELAATDPELNISVTETAAPAQVMTTDAQRRIVEALDAAPNGVIRMSDTIPGLVETSTNLGKLAAADGAFTATFLTRSSVDSEREAVQQTIASVFDLAGMATKTHDAYPAWAPDPASPLLTLTQSVYRDLFGHEAEVMAIHAALETSTIGAKIPGLAMISIGPTVLDVHTPDEHLEVATVGEVYDLLVATLERLSA